MGSRGRQSQRLIRWDAEARSSGFDSVEDWCAAFGTDLTTVRDLVRKCNYSLKEAVEKGPPRRNRKVLDYEDGSKRRCVSCLEVKDLNSQNFTRHSRSKSGFMTECNSCRSKTNLSVRYGMKPEDYDNTLVSQNMSCALCGELLGLDTHVDHDHDTGRVRGVLHSSCNWLVGHIESPPRAAPEVLLQKTIVYLSSMALVLPDKPSNIELNDPASGRWANHRVTSTEFENMKKKGCSICGTLSQDSDKKWHVDHDHKLRDALMQTETGVRAKRSSIRGLLCQPCNLMLGHAGVDKTNNEAGILKIRQAVEYLSRACDHND